MIHFFSGPQNLLYVVQSISEISKEDEQKLRWLFQSKEKDSKDKVNDPTASIEAHYIGPRAAMITPWSTNAVEITQNMGINGIQRIERFTSKIESFDPMLLQQYKLIDQNVFTINIKPEAILEIEDIAAYNEQEGLALSNEEIEYLEKLALKLNRKLTDSEVFGFSQVNSEHCRHKIFNGVFVIDGEEKPTSLFKLIKKTSEANSENIVSAYKDNVAFLKGPVVTQFAPQSPSQPSSYQEKEFESIISLKAETHNFPTTVEPFNGAATGSGGEIRDRLAGGIGSLPLAGTAVYMTSYSRLNTTRPWEQKMQERKWLYQSPIDILIKASNGASDFGNKFGQPLISGSLLTFEHEENAIKLGFDKVIMLAGGIGYGKKEHAEKNKPAKGDKIVILGGENYRIGMGGAAVSSADTGEFGSGIELNAVQRSNPEMQKRAANAIRAMVESDENTIVSIHDHGAGGHLNCLSELVEETGGKIDLDKLPVGDPTLSAKEIIGNESQERMGLVISEENAKQLKIIADRERSPMYEVGEVTGDHRFTFESQKSGEKPMDFALSDMFGSSPTTYMVDSKLNNNYKAVTYDVTKFEEYLSQVLQLEAVACKDWLTNKVDRCVGGRVAKQQCVGPLQLPLNNVGVMALDFKSGQGIATSIGHSPISGLINPEAGSRNSIGEALSNIMWAPLEKGLASVSLSANWMWPCRNPGEDARLYAAVEACSQFAIDLGINIPTGKDSLSMKQKYPNDEVIAPGTVIISAAAHCKDITKVVEPVFKINQGDIYYINLTQDELKLGGSSFAQVVNAIGKEAPNIRNAAYFKTCFNSIQEEISNSNIIAGHDVGSGGLITSILEMCFADNQIGAEIDLNDLKASDLIEALFNENIGIVIQANETTINSLSSKGVQIVKLGKVNQSSKVRIQGFDRTLSLDVSKYRDIWFKTSYLLDEQQTANGLALKRFENYKVQPLKFKFPTWHTGQLPTYDGERPLAAIIREKGSNSEREMAHAMYLAGFEVRDVHMTDLISGRETLEDLQFIGAVGGFSNSDVLGSAKGWAGAFLYNEKANKAINDFFKREDTLSVGICNGCQLLMELELINPDHEVHGKLKHNLSQKHESNFTSVHVQKNNSVMLSTLEGSTLGVWISHGEGRFDLPQEEQHYNIVAKYGYKEYPANPNGSDYNTAMMCDSTGRHLVMMPHIERSIFQWNWANYSADHKQDIVSPWLEAFVNARKWVLENRK